MVFGHCCQFYGSMHCVVKYYSIFITTSVRVYERKLYEKQRFRKNACY